MARAAAQAKWGDGVPLRDKILELREGEDCVVVGTLFKDMPLKPSILDEYAKDRGISPAALGKRASIVSPEDTLLLEGMILLRRIPHLTASTFRSDRSTAPGGAPRARGLSRDGYRGGGARLRARRWRLPH